MKTKLRWEPALLYAFAAALFAVLAAYGIIGEDKLTLWEALVFAAIALAQGILTRSDSISMAKIHEAGYTAVGITERAKNPAIDTVREDDFSLSV